jgi:hypothetical protein
VGKLEIAEFPMIKDDPALIHVNSASLSNGKKMSLQAVAQTISIAVLALCSGCASLIASGGGSSGVSSHVPGGAVSTAVSNPSIFDITARSTKIAFISPAAFLTSNSAIADEVVREQCRFKTPDPLFFVPDESKQINWTLVGRLGEDPYFQALEYRSIFTLGLKSGDVQLNTWPLQIASLADMPHLFLEHRLETLGEADLGPGNNRELTQEYFQQERRIESGDRPDEQLQS